MKEIIFYVLMSWGGGHQGWAFSGPLLQHQCENLKIAMAEYARENRWSVGSIPMAKCVPVGGSASE